MNETVEAAEWVRGVLDRVTNEVGLEAGEVLDETLSKTDQPVEGELNRSGNAPLRPRLTKTVTRWI